MVGLVSSYIEHFTYIGLFVVLMLCGLGLPVPEDVALLAGGYLVHRGITRYPVTLAVSLVGVVAGDNSLYFLGRHVGAGVLSYFGLRGAGPDGHVERIERFMERHGHLAIFYARFLAGLRALVYLSAGSFGVPPGRFFVYDVAGALISVPVVVSAGYLFGGQLERAIAYIGGLEKLIWIVVALCALIYTTRLVVLQWSGEKS